MRRPTQASAPWAPTLFDLGRAPKARSAAGVSPCGRFRYWLTRTWDTAAPLVCFVMLNPSRADAETDDPTVRRCCAFARGWGAGGIAVVNLLAYRTPYPHELLSVPDPVGPENDRWIRTWTEGRRVIAGWGAAARYARGRDREVLALLAGRRVECLGVTRDGSPRHPVRLRADLEPVPYSPEGRGL